MKIQLMVDASVALTGDLEKDENRCLALCRQIAPKLGIKSSRFKDSGAGSGFGRRDAGIYCDLKETEAERILGMPTKKLVKLTRFKKNGVKLDMIYISADLAGKDITLFSTISGKNTSE